MKNKMNRSKTLIAFCCVLLASCATQKTAKLYPANEKAAKYGVLEASFTDNSSGKGPISFTTPEGEVFSGEYTVVFGSAVGFGGIFGSVYGPAGAVGALAAAPSYSFGGKGQGIANLFSDKGNSISCEFLSEIFGGQGYGACQSSNGELYKIHF